MKFFKLSWILLSLFLSVLHADVIAHFNTIKQDPNALYAFFKTMPKGGELHYHLAGGAYPETMLDLASKADYCIDKTTFAISPDTKNCDGILSKNLKQEPEFYAQVLKSWSLKDFIPGNESAHDHFFNGFPKYMPLINAYRPMLLAEILQRAAAQHENYLEILDIPDNGESIIFGDRIKKAGSLSEKRALLLADPAFQKNITHTVNEAEATTKRTRKYLKCDEKPRDPACQIRMTFLYYTLREQPFDNVFAQTLNAFESVSRSKGTLVGVNIVQAEDGIISLKDYKKHMELFKFLHELYPNVPISLHAGELSAESVVPAELQYHIHDALFTGHAQRIGHGADIGYENNAQAILKYMAKHSIPAEINLVSNEKLLNLSGPNHPVNFYLKHQVPVVFSSDDEGVLRTDLTRQYVEAVLKHHIDYPSLKRINRNTLTYAFIPGKSIWADAAKGILVPECRDLNAERCKAFIKTSEKAALQWNLEQQLLAFERQF